MKLFKNLCLFLLIFLFHLQLLHAQEKSIKKNKKKNNYDQETDNYLELFENVFNRLNSTYVDSINNSEIILSGIKGMMKPLDPYTKLLMGRTKDNYDILRRGKYGGVGISIDEVRDTIIITGVYQDSPSYFEGLSPGDMIIKIDSTNAIGIGISKAIKLLKGDIDVKVDISIYRKSQKTREVFTLRRGNITVNNVPYWGIDQNKIGYIKINKFSKNTSNLFKEGLDELRDLEMKGLIIDLRLNGGGLLNEATKILDSLLPIDTDNPILFRKGRTKNTEYFSRKEPSIDISIPIIVLQDKRSASASEIVSGVLQDLDRAIIMGTDSFGKGLVQITNALNDSISLKITTAKYYLPSGRLIQKSDYLGNGVLTDGLDKKDSTFYTSNGREVTGGSGISPDIKTKKDIMPFFINSLWKNERLFISFVDKVSSDFSNNAFNLYRKFLYNKYGDDFSNLDSNLFSINIYKDNKDFYEVIRNNKQKVIEFIKRYELINEANKIYNQLNRYERFQNLTYNDIDKIISHVYRFKDYFISATTENKRPTASLLKEYISDISDEYKDGEVSIGEHDLYQIILKLLGIINSIEIKNLDTIEQYIDEIDYSNIEKEVKNYTHRMDALLKQIELQNDVINWYIKIISNHIESPHFSIPFNEYDKEYISREINLDKIKKILISNFKDYIEEYDFQYSVQGEKEFEKLKDVLNIYPDFSKDTSNTDNVFQSYIKNSKYNRLIKELNKFISRKKNKYFFTDENKKWIINGILREYSRLAMNNRAAIKTSLYIDSEYYQAIEIVINSELYKNTLSIE